MNLPIIGITTDASETAYTVGKDYARAVDAAGGLPILLPHRVERLDEYLEVCDGFVFTGGDDPWMEPFGEPTHPKAKPIDPDRQDFEVTLLERLGDRPALGICLGMQLMALVAGGRLDQHLPETLPTHDMHWGRKPHVVRGALGEGETLSNHRQAVRDAASLEVVAVAPDGVIEAVRDASRPFHLGVQWHAERSGDGPLGLGLFRQLVNACRQSVDSAEFPGG